MIRIDPDLCSGCGACAEVCPTGAIQVTGRVAQVNRERCTGCEACVEVCPTEAIAVVSELILAETILEPAGRGQVVPAAIRPQEIILVDSPPPSTATPAPPTLARQFLPPLGAALALLGRELAPRLLRLATDWAQGQALYPREAPSRGSRRQVGRGRRGHRRRQKRRGRR